MNTSYNIPSAIQIFNNYYLKLKMRPLVGRQKGTVQEIADVPTNENHFLWSQNVKEDEINHNGDRINSGTIVRYATHHGLSCFRCFAVPNLSGHDKNATFELFNINDASLQFIYFMLDAGFTVFC